MKNKELTIVINTFRSNDKIYKCLNSISDNYQTLVIENSNDKSFKLTIEKKYKNVKCFLTKKNLGYAKGNNYGLRYVKTKYCLILNPDALLYKNSLKNFFNFTKKIKDFSIVAPFDKNKTKFQNLLKPYEVNYVKGFAIFLNMKEFDKIGFFDKNFFIYCEEIDLCKRLKNSGKKIFIDPSIKINHLGGSSHNNKINYEMELSRNWHWMWSQFYYNKKHFGYLISLIKFFPKIFTYSIKLFIYLIICEKTKFNIYQKRLYGLCNSMMGKKSWYRPKV